MMEKIFLNNPIPTFPVVDYTDTSDHNFFFFCCSLFDFFSFFFLKKKKKIALL